MIEEAQIICKTVHLLLCICVLCTVQEAGLAQIIDECFSPSPPASLPLWMRIFLWTVTRRQREVTRPTRAREQRVSAGQERGRLLSRSRAGASCLVTRSETARLVTRGAMCTCLACRLPMYETPLVYETCTRHRCTRHRQQIYYVRRRGTRLASRCISLPAGRHPCAEAAREALHTRCEHADCRYT